MKWEKFKVNIPEGKVGKWKISKFEVSKEAERAQQLRAAVNPQRRDRSVPAGEYRGIFRNGEIIMSDTRAEIAELKPLFKQVRGGDNVLVFGLGLGVAIQGLMKMGASNVTVVELDPEVIELSGPYWEHTYPKQLTIIQGNAKTFKPTEGFDLVWYDIWDDISRDNIDEMKSYHNAWKDKARWIGNWAEDQASEQKTRIENGHGFY